MLMVRRVRTAKKTGGPKLEWLKLTFPEYRQASTKVEVNTKGQAGEVQVVCDEATRKAMIDARNRF
jgi:hypothetical protein